MPQAFVLQAIGGSLSSPSTDATVKTDVQLDLQTPSSTLCQHLDPEALPRPDCFESLDELHLWTEMQLGPWNDDDLQGASDHVGPPASSSSKPSGTATSRPRLLVCHDFQGGYAEDPQIQGYSLEHMHLVDTFIYFSHKRVSIPPNGWITAAARTGTKVLGTLIFEWQESVPDLAKLFRGPTREDIPVFREPAFSPQYAIDLIELAHARGFSGYLINVEVGLDLGDRCSGKAWSAWAGEQARYEQMQCNAKRLRAWVHYLREEGRKFFATAGKDPDEWEIMWYDSVVYPHGQLAWQDALNEHNIDFFQAANTFFTNYTWARPPQPLPPGQLIDPGDENPQILQLRGYGLTGPHDGGHHPHLVLSAAMADSIDRSRGDVYVGIDVFGRNCWGGLRAWKSLDMIGPHRRATNDDALGLSVALFAPGWTWEDENAGLALDPVRAAQARTWSDWWHVDSAFWTGVSEQPAVTPHRITLSDTDVKPVQTYFNRSNLDPDRCRRRANAQGFYTNFSFGSGTKWFDRGELVYDWSTLSSSGGKANATSGFTDMGVSMPKPDLFYAEWHEGKQRERATSPQVDVTSWQFDHERVWSGNASFVVSLAACGNGDTAEVEPFRIPLCSAVISDDGKDSDGQNGWRYTIVFDANGADIEPLLENAASNQTAIVADPDYRDLGNGWRAATITLRSRLSSDQDAASIPLTLGLTARLSAQHTAQIRIGAVHLSRTPASPSQPKRQHTSLEVRPAADVFDSSSYDKQTTWLRASVLSWTPPSEFLNSMYSNVWVQQVDKPATRVWLGTSTREAEATDFCLPHHLALPSPLAREAQSFEFVVTSLDILDRVDIAKGPAPLL